MAKPTAETSFTFRINTRLKLEFLRATDKENKPGSQVLRDLMAAYVERKKRKEFEAEARRQSRLIASSDEEEAVMDWMRDVPDAEPGK